MSSKSNVVDQVIDREFVQRLVPGREPGHHKWKVGGVVIVGGAPGYIGAPALSARAASRSGAGIVTVAVSRATVGPVATLVPEATFVPLPEGDPRSAAQRAISLIRERAERSRSMVVGPGLSQDEYAKALLAALFGFSSEPGSGKVGFASTRTIVATGDDTHLAGGVLPAVVDADALTWLSNEQEWWTKVPAGKLLLTPHQGEMARLTGRDVEEIRSNPRAAAVEAASKWQQKVLLKGPRAILTDGSTVYEGPETPLSLATAGSGDVLAGCLGALIAQGLSLMDAGALAIYAGTAAAKSLEREFGQIGVIATDLPDAIARILAELARTPGP